MRLKNWLAFAGVCTLMSTHALAQEVSQDDRDFAHAVRGFIALTVQKVDAADREFSLIVPKKDYLGADKYPHVITSLMKGDVARAEKHLEAALVLPEKDDDSWGGMIDRATRYHAHLFFAALVADAKGDRPKVYSSLAGMGESFFQPYSTTALCLVLPFISAVRGDLKQTLAYEDAWKALDRLFSTSGFGRRSEYDDSISAALKVFFTYTAGDMPGVRKQVQDRILSPNSSFTEHWRLFYSLVTIREGEKAKPIYDKLPEWQRPFTMGWIAATLEHFPDRRAEARAIYLELSEMTKKRDVYPRILGSEDLAFVEMGLEATKPQ